MKWKRFKVALRHITFWLLLVLMVGYLPSRLSYFFFLLAMLACPYWLIAKIVDEMLEIAKERWYCASVLVIVMGFLPFTEFERFGEGIAMLLGKLFP